MNTLQIVHFAALSGPAVVTIALAQFMALLGHLRRATDMRVARAGVPAEPTR